VCYVNWQVCVCTPKFYLLDSKALVFLNIKPLFGFTKGISPSHEGVVWGGRGRKRERGRSEDAGVGLSLLIIARGQIKRHLRDHILGGVTMLLELKNDKHVVGLILLDQSESETLDTTHKKVKTLNA
jgi:hypothetical protein